MIPDLDFYIIFHLFPSRQKPLKEFIDTGEENYNNKIMKHV